MQMRSNKPYLLRAFYEWIVDSNCTPIVVVDATHPRCKIPSDYAQGGEIVFNISPTAIRELNIKNEAIEFKASFSGVIHVISAPVKAILALYAEENNEGIFFDGEEDANDVDEEVLELKSIEGTGGYVPTDSAVKRERPFLKLVE